jgi:hypothetical protein
MSRCYLKNHNKPLKPIAALRLIFSLEINNKERHKMATGARNQQTGRAGGTFWSRRTK